MAAVASLDSMNATLSQWLRLLWDMSAPVRLDSALPYIAQGVIHLPSGSHWREPSAAASHAAAHLVYSPPSFNGEGLGPIARALVALLEDARVEALAMRELPGLARLWRPLHTASPATGAGFEALMQRLARALADPGYDDPDPWVRKGRALFFLDATLGLLALRTPADVRKAAVLLGNDIGQMRLQFNAKTYRPAPAYRDDHRWMWAADVLTQVPPPAVAAGGDVLDDHDPAVDTNEVVTHHPEWDHLISRVRADWCRVVERPAPPGGDATAPYDGDVVRAGLRLRAPLRRLTHLSAVPCRSDEGEAFDQQPHGGGGGARERAGWAQRAPRGGTLRPCHGVGAAGHRRGLCGQRLQLARAARRPPGDGEVLRRRGRRAAGRSPAGAQAGRVDAAWRRIAARSTPPGTAPRGTAVGDRSF